MSQDGRRQLALLLILPFGAAIPALCARLVANVGRRVIPWVPRHGLHLPGPLVLVHGALPPEHSKPVLLRHHRVPHVSAKRVVHRVDAHQGIGAHRSRHGPEAAAHRRHRRPRAAAAVHGGGGERGLRPLRRGEVVVVHLVPVVVELVVLRLLRLWPCLLLRVLRLVCSRPIAHKLVLRRDMRLVATGTTALWLREARGHLLPRRGVGHVVDVGHRGQRGGNGQGGGRGGREHGAQIQIGGGRVGGGGRADGQVVEADLELPRVRRNVVLMHHLVGPLVDVLLNLLLIDLLLLLRRHLLQKLPLLLGRHLLLGGMQQIGAVLVWLMLRERRGRRQSGAHLRVSRRVEGRGLGLGRGRVLELGGTECVHLTGLARRGRGGLERRRVALRGLVEEGRLLRHHHLAVQKERGN